MFGSVLAAGDSIQRLWLGWEGEPPSRHDPPPLLPGSEGDVWRAQVPLGGSEGVQRLFSCEAGILPWMGTRAAAGRWLVGIPQPSSWFSLLFPSRPCWSQ